MNTTLKEFAKRFGFMLWIVILRNFIFSLKCCLGKEWREISLKLGNSSKTTIQKEKEMYPGKINIKRWSGDIKEITFA